ncbi:putative MFS monosaccharide transporter [Poronia punctata]|nr:putative MFS monosaccharide transporter [Poronia punctata]
MRLSWYTLGIALTASLGTFLFASLASFPFGFDTGIITTTIAHQSWIDYMGHPSKGITGAVVAVYIAGEAVGAILQIFMGDRLGRKRFMQLACIIVTVGAVIQAAAVNIGMLLAGRVLAGIAVGALSGTVPIYLSEISPPQTRGLVGGIGGVGISFGTMTANWIGFAGSYAPYGPVQWRLPLALQAPWGIILFVCLATYMPHSPRQLIQRGKIAEARKEFAKTGDGMSAHEVEEEFNMMRAQIEYEKNRDILSYREIFKLYRRRVLVSISVQVLTTSTYKSLGMDAKTILALVAAWGTCAFISNAISVVYLPDFWGRRKMLLAGVACVIVTEIYSAVLQRVYENTDNRVGKGFAILGIYLFVVCYYGLINSTTWLYGSEVLPISIRNKIVGVSAAAHYIVNVAFTQAGPTAFANIHENYYYVFVGICVIYFVLIYLYFPETKQKSLEEIAAAFGDRVVDVDERDVKANVGLREEKMGEI